MIFNLKHDNCISFINYSLEYIFMKYIMEMAQIDIGIIQLCGEHGRVESNFILGTFPEITSELKRSKSRHTEVMH